MLHKVKTSHPVVQAVRAHHGLNPNKVRKANGSICDDNTNPNV